MSIWRLWWAHHSSWRTRVRLVCSIPAVLWRVRRAVANLKAIYRQEFGASAGIRVFPEPDPEVERGRRRRWWWVAVMGPAVVVLATLFGKRRV